MMYSTKRFCRRVPVIWKLHVANVKGSSLLYRYVVTMRRNNYAHTFLFRLRMLGAKRYTCTLIIATGRKLYYDCVSLIPDCSVGILHIKWYLTVFETCIRRESRWCDFNPFKISVIFIINYSNRESILVGN